MHHSSSAEHIIYISGIPMLVWLGFFYKYYENKRLAAILFRPPKLQTESQCNEVFSYENKHSTEDLIVLFFQSSNLNSSLQYKPWYQAEKNSSL